MAALASMGGYLKAPCSQKNTYQKEIFLIVFKNIATAACIKHCFFIQYGFWLQTLYKSRFVTTNRRKNLYGRQKKRSELGQE